MSVLSQQLVRLRNNDCLELAALTFLYYDHAITFPDEVLRIWSRPFSRPSFLFYLNRYIPFFGNIVLLIFTYSDLASTDKRIRSGATTTPRSKSSPGLTPPGHAHHGTIRSPVEAVSGCHMAISTVTGIHLAVAWEAQAVFDLLVFSLTIRKTLQTRESMGRRMGFTGVSIVDLVYRDGAIYFAVMALANLANIFTFYFADPLTKGVLSTFASCISVTMISRLMLNLYEAVSPPAANGVGGNSTFLIFSTRIEAGNITAIGAASDEGWSNDSGVPVPAWRLWPGDGALEEAEEPHDIELVDIRNANVLVIIDVDTWLAFD
ncbi:hypothetical protein BV25DRAFT_694044 [Artomyces pyxidatus]|uniref:Uncharacterized protein n=1 Tax=Artomyces pyxidatus TaxID=48021 RepID=A0ACB8T0V7_9AGAM|nr:hypothetical protein BV25DRAFT_694044 [Artomyces pyxidatus]